MINSKLVFTILLFIAVINKIESFDQNAEIIFGERIDGPANFRDTVNGKILFTLDDDVLVETSPVQNNWLMAGVTVMLTPRQAEDFKIMPGTRLISTGNKVIGKTLDTVQIWMAEENTGFIGAYTHIGNIKSSSVPENILIEHIRQNKTHFIDFEEFVEGFNFQEFNFGNLSNFKEYYIYESIIVDMSPRDRITLLFSRENKLKAIIHTRPIQLEKMKTYELIRGHKLTVIGEMKQDEIKTLIQKRIEFYNSVD